MDYRRDITKGTSTMINPHYIEAFKATYLAERSYSATKIAVKNERTCKVAAKLYESKEEAIQAGINSARSLLDAEDSVDDEFDYM